MGRESVFERQCNSVRKKKKVIFSEANSLCALLSETASKTADNKEPELPASLGESCFYSCLINTLPYFKSCERHRGDAASPSPCDKTMITKSDLSMA